MNQKIAISRHDDNFSFLNEVTNSNKRIRLGSVNPNKLNQVDYTPISTNGHTVLYNQKYFEIHEFFHKVKSENVQNLIVLTTKEKSKILEDLLIYNQRMYVLEELYPIFSDLKYISNLERNLNELVKRLNDVRNLCIKGGSLNKSLSTKYRYAIERAIRYKSELDSTLYFACLPPYQEVFKLTEKQKDRVIFSVDYNSMFAKCIQGSFPDPRKLKLKSFKDSYELNELSPDGVYRVLLIGAKNSIFLKHHPLKFSRSNQSFHFNLEVGDNIEVFLPRDEIIYYTSFFEGYRVYSGIVSSREVLHPLSKTVQTLYNDRKSSRIGCLKNSLAKQSIVIATSVTNAKRYIKVNSEQPNDIINFFEQHFKCRFDDSFDVFQKLELAKISNRLVTSGTNINKLRSKVINYKNRDSIYSFHSKMLSNSRIMMMKLMEKLLKIKTVEICYANVDSIHFSLNRDMVNEVRSFLNEECSDELGKLKIETQATFGYWFDLGRYWLGKENFEVTKYSNTLFNNSFDNKIYNRRRVLKKVDSIQGYRYISYLPIAIEKTFSFKKKLVVSNNPDQTLYKRFDYSEIKSAPIASNSVNKEKITNYRHKFSLLNEMASNIQQITTEM
ncbi:hypothetical protein [Vibrio diabolicus]|uniref:hypothetical protein n=1 Tax=Vibrio diabolicus TaxID=50719 RepID=UPI0024956B31|nr:hypothetical protein [Vibrio diabolicus]